MFKLRPSKFNRLRSVSDQIAEQGWIWRGSQKLDGLCCMKSRFVQGQWVEVLAVWLDHAKAVYESNEYVVLLFEDKVEVDCDQLGRCLPLKELYGALSSFPFTVSDTHKNSVEDLENSLMIINEGERVVENFSSFQSVDPANWWDFTNVEVVGANRLPTLKGFFRGMSPGRSTPFDAIAYDAGLGDLRKRLKSGKRKSRRGMKSIGGAMLTVLSGVIRFILWCGLIAGVLFLIFNWDSILTGLQGFDWTYIIVIALIAYVLFLIGMTPEKLIGPGAGSEGTGRSGDYESGGRQVWVNPALSNIFMRAAGWMFWNSGLGSGVRNKYAKRVAELEKLFEQGDVEEALRRSLSLAANAKKKQGEEKRQWFGDYPFSGPGRRDNLNIPFQDFSTPAYSILSELGYEGLAELYRKQAEKLVEKEEYDHAAFIYVELLGDIEAAVRVFEKKGDFRTAAKLAQGRRLNPSVFIPLWFKAGEKELALKLAAQYDAFPELNSYVQISDPFYKEFIEVWAMRLADARDYAKALEISVSVASMATVRREWMIKALARDKSNPLLLARAIKCFPEFDHPVIQAAWERLIEGTSSDAARNRKEVAYQLALDSFERACVQDEYMAQRLPVLALPLIRKMMEDEAVFGMDEGRRNAAVSLSSAAQQLALRVDLRRLNKVSVKTEATPETPKHITLRDAGGLKPIRHVLAVPGNRLLVAYESGALQLLNEKGRIVWSDQVHRVRGLVPIASGRSVFVVREEIAGQFLSVVQVDEGRHLELGPSNFISFHTQASEVGWMVHIDNRVCMLDVQSLLRRRDGGEPEQYWAIPVMEAGNVRAYMDQPQQASFIFDRSHEELTEEWVLDKNSLKVDSYIVWLEKGNIPKINVLNWTGNVASYAYSREEGRFEKHWFRRQQYTLKDERRLLADPNVSAFPEQLQMSGCKDSSNSVIYCVLSPDAKPVSSVPVTGKSNQQADFEWVGATSLFPSDLFRITFSGAEFVQTHIPDQGSVAVVFDNKGRLVVVDMMRKRIIYQNA